MDIEQLIKNGESKTVEFKEKIATSENISKTVVAFSNTSGGKILIGINDNKEVVGLDEDEIASIQDKISNIIYDVCYPLIIPEISTNFILNKLIILITIYPGSLKPYYIKSKGRDSGTYIRVGATNKIADENAIAELERQKLNITFDEEIVTSIELESLNLKKLKDDFTKYTGKTLEEAQIINMKLAKLQGKKLFPTRGMLLLSDNNELFDYARVRCARFKGFEVGDFLDQKEYFGSLYEIVENSMIFLKNHLNKSGTIKGLQRKDSYEIPENAMREAVLNAVVHRDYSIIGSDTKIEIFDDRVQISSPGSLLKTLTIEDIKLGRSEVRNRVIVRFFREIKFMEQWGSGIRRILKECKECGLKEPEFEENGQHFTVIFYRGKTENSTDKIQKSTDKSTDKMKKSTDKIIEKYGKLNNNEYKVIEYLMKNNSIKNKEVVEISELTSEGAKKLLQRLTKKQIISAIGAGKSRYYIL